MKEVNPRLTRLQADLARPRASLESVDRLLGLSEDIVANKLVEEGAIEAAQTQFMLDSFRVNKFHKDYKTWESKEIDTFVDDEVLVYNKQLGKMARINEEIEILETEYDKVRRQIKIPSFKFSIQTIQKYNEGELLRFVDQIDGKYPSTVDSTSIFSLSSESNLLPLDFSMFNRLLNIEYRLRMERQIKYEVLVVAKQQLTAKNQKWATRDSALNQFITKDLQHMLDEVSKIRENEQDDLKDYEVLETDNEMEPEPEMEPVEEEQEQEQEQEQESEDEATPVPETEATPKPETAVETTEEPEQVEPEQDPVADDDDDDVMKIDG